MNTERSVIHSVSQLTNLLVIANSSLNVVIYMTFNTRFRQVVHFHLCPVEGAGEKARFVMCDRGA